MKILLIKTLIKTEKKKIFILKLPLNGFFLKNRSKVASLCCLPDFQYAYAILI